MESTASECFRAVRTCDTVLDALARYPVRDGAIERLEFAIMDDRLEALLGARENLDEVADAAGWPGEHARVAERSDQRRSWGGGLQVLRRA